MSSDVVNSFPGIKVLTTGLNDFDLLPSVRVGCRGHSLELAAGHGHNGRGMAAIHFIMRDGMEGLDRDGITERDVLHLLGNHGSGSVHQDGPARSLVA